MSAAAAAAAPEALLAAAWLAGPAGELRRARLTGRFPHALLIHDRRGAGGAELAAYAAQLALCRGAAPPCGQCRDCRQLASGAHPDFFTVTPEADARVIRVEQIRELCEALALTAHSGQASVALIAPADSLNANACNALLKTLEEPRPGVTLLLLAAAPSRLPATLLSRCQRVRVPAPRRAESVAWLERQRGPGPWASVLEVLGEAPFAALGADAAGVAQLAEETARALEALVGRRQDAAALAEGWGRAESFDLRLSCIENWLTSRITALAGRASQSRELRSGAHSGGAGSELNMQQLLRVLDGLYELRRLRQTSVNRALALEVLLWGLAAPARGSGRGT